MLIGDDDIGFVTYENVAKNQRWTTLRVSNPTFVRRAKKLAQGELHLPQRAQPIAIPITPARHLAQVGPVDRDINGRDNSPFSKRAGYAETDEYPMLWNHPPKGKETLQSRMLVVPDSHGEVRQNRHKAAEQMWNDCATHLHISKDFQFNANPLAAAFTQSPSLGGRAWPTLMASSMRHGKALCAWLNGTLGLISYWLQSYRNQDGRGELTVTAIPDIPVLDVTKLEPVQFEAAVKIFDDLQNKQMLPANEAWRDPVRQELDRRLLDEVLGLDDKAVEQLGILRRQWCAEPTVTSVKKTGSLD